MCEAYDEWKGDIICRLVTKGITACLLIRLPKALGRFHGLGDVSTPGASSNAYQDSIELPKTPITRACSKHFLEVILASNAKPWFETRANAHKINSKQLSKEPVHCWQADPSSFLASRALSSSTQLI
ncbi:hypothetical protein PVK06_035275 [Gossypium arboreum]|uniref:Uncharacterized protein n=1 Tax=Gossypium arboreum TaxID=29729 RepID=A0ABR0NGE0_GOSAR|nr:hypothetical protein PVK06_035275 [Gossypium arboreum]